MKKSADFLLPFLGFSHFLVDFCCTAMMASLCSRLSLMHTVVCTLLYNGMAFAFQLPLGALGDLLDAKRSFCAIGCALVAIGTVIGNAYTLCLVIGLGNALFHVGGGREVLLKSRGASGFVGRFVAPGAIGIFLGPRLNGIFWLCRCLLPLLLLVAAGIFFLKRRSSAPAMQPAGFSPIRTIIALGCMFLTVLLRSYMGTILSYPFLSQPALAFLFTLGIFLGKYLGGTLADRFGTVPLSAFAQLTASVLFALSVFFPPLAIAAILLFNTSMAITATALYRCLPRLPGTMFGFTTFALFLGILPKLFSWPSPFFNWWGLGLLSVLSAVLLLGGLQLLRGGHYAPTAEISASVSGPDPVP